MDAESFRESAGALSEALKKTLIDHFRHRQIRFDLSTMPLPPDHFEQIAIDAHLYGANLFPSEV